MKPNINDLSKVAELREALSEKRVSPAAIDTIERALKKGMVFRKPTDLSILNLSAGDLDVISPFVTFGTRIVVEKNIKTVEYTFNPVGDEDFFFGYQLVVRFTNRAGFGVEQAFPIEDSRAVIVDFDLNDLKEGRKVALQVNSAQGERSKISLGAPTNEMTEEVIELTVAALANATVNVKIEPVPQPGDRLVEDAYQIKGKLISNRTSGKSDGFQIVIYAATEVLPDDSPVFFPVAFATTESNGYFVTSYLMFNDPLDIGRVKHGKASVSKDDFEKEFPIKLITKTVVDGGDQVTKTLLPDRLILVINEDEDVADEGCKDCGCTDLNFHEKKVLEEFSYYTVVRTTEPSIIADVLEEEEEIDLEDIYGVNLTVPYSVFQKYHLIQSKQVSRTNFIRASTTPVITANVAERRIGDGSAGSTDSDGASSALAPRAGGGAVFDRDLIDKLVVEHKVKTVIVGNDKPVFKGRTHLNPLNRIEWDEPTIYQAASIAHGHLLHFKQEWLPDGYSIGDLVYSLPLAPGQKKQIAVLDWERRESAANSQFLGYEETLNNSLIRDRDISEVVTATLNENIRGSSRATTGGIGFGFGSAVMGILPGGGTFGSLLGISGGKSSSGSSASQSAHRDSTASSLQNITDRTVQAANVVRSQRSTVVQTVSQGERVQATAESVANYNHCHAITIQYFEVLRHFAIHNRLAGVQECLFVPLQMEPFDPEKCLRWRNTLEKHLLRGELRQAFAAITRIQNEKESPFENYYQSIGFPRNNFAEQFISIYSGEIFLDFSFFNTSDDIDDDLKKFFKIFGIDPTEFADRKLTNKELSEIVGPRTIEFLLNALVIETDKGVDLKLDVSLISQFRPNVPLQVTLRQDRTTPTSVRRNEIEAINIRLDESKVASAEITDIKQFKNKYMKVRVRSGNLRYQMDNFADKLFSGRIENDLFVGDDSVFIPTPLSRDELRNPIAEDVEAANNLLHHLNENLEYYHKCIFFDMTPERRFMLLDGIIAPGKANGRSVASVVENRVIGIAGNSLILPVAPGNQLDPTIDEDFKLFSQYYEEEREPSRVSMPTKGIYAEAVMGKCNSCEEKDESRFWRWEESPIPDSPNTQILPLNTDTRRADPGDLEPKDFPTPVVNIQNAPNLPDPSGLQSILQLIGKGDSFRDLTGLNQNQLNALATFQKSLDTAQAFGKEAAELAKSAAAMKMVEDAKKNGTISNEQAKDKGAAIIDKAKSDQNTNRLKDAVGVIDQLEKEGKISASDSAIAKNKLLGSFIDSSNVGSPMSNEEIRGLSDSSRTNNTDISVTRPDGEKVEITSQGDPSGVLNAEAFADVEQQNPSNKRTFFPDVLDKSGVIEMVAVATDEPAGALFNWTARPANNVVIDNAQGLRTRVMARAPGVADLTFDVMDSTSRLLRRVTTRVGVPQFFVVRAGFSGQYNGFTRGRNIADAHLFDTVLAQLHLTNDRNQIIDRIKTLVESSLIRKLPDGSLYGHNLRLIWQLGTHNEATPLPFNAVDFNSADFINGVYTVIDLAGYPLDQQQPLDIRSLFAVTFPTIQGQISGPRTPNELITIFTGQFEINSLPNLQFTIPSSQDVYKWINKMLTKFNANQNDQDLRDLVVEVFARLFANVIVHEIYHSVMFSRKDAQGRVIEDDLDQQGHTLPAFGKDIMSVGRDFFERTAINVHEQQAQFPDLGSFVMGDLLGLSNHKLNARNYERVSLNFPLPGTLLFP